MPTAVEQLFVDLRKLTDRYLAGESIGGRIWQRINQLVACRDWPSDGFTSSHSKELNEIQVRVRNYEKFEYLGPTRTESDITNERERIRLEKILRKERKAKVKQLLAGLVRITIVVQENHDNLSEREYSALKAEVQELLRELRGLYRQAEANFDWCSFR